MNSIPDDESKELLRQQAKKKAEQNYKKGGIFSEQFGDKLMMYVQSSFWVALSIVVLYYSNFFHHLFWNPKINQVFFQISMAGYTFLVILIIYTSMVLPYILKVKSIEEYNPKLIPIGAVIGVISVLSLLIAIWPVWGFTSFLIFISLWKGFFSLSVFLPSGPLGDVLFMVINVGSVLSFYIIEHEGYFH